MNRLKMFAAVFCFLLPFQIHGDDGGNVSESAWGALVREDPSIVDDESITPDERRMLQSVTAEEAVGLLGGGPHTVGSNVMTGMSALSSLTTGQHNVAMGVDALSTLTTGVANTSVGRSSLRFTNGFRNTAIGQTAMRDHTSGGNNTAVGDNALRRSLTGTSNTAVGAQSLDDNMSHNNTGIGTQALSNSTTGFGNIALGYRAGAGITTGSNNILIGNAGTAMDIGVTRIGTDAIHRSTFVSGIHGTDPPGPTETVVINAAGRLGTRPAATSTVVPCPGGPSPVTCSCPVGVVVGGGGICAPGYVLNASFPSSGTAWDVGCVPVAGPPPPPPPSFAAPLMGEAGVASAFAVCIP